MSRKEGLSCVRVNEIGLFERVIAWGGDCCHQVRGESEWIGEGATWAGGESQRSQCQSYITSGSCMHSSVKSVRSCGGEETR